MTNILIQDRRKDTVGEKVDAGGSWNDAVRRYLGPSKAERDNEEFSPKAFKEVRSCLHLDFGLLVSRTVGEYIYLVLSYPVCGNLLWQLQATNINYRFIQILLEWKILS
jgi:hypothetical protein